MKVRIIADSSADTLSLEGVDFISVPLSISTNDKEYIDDEKLDVKSMINDLALYKGKSSTSCPSTGKWLEAFTGADEIYVVTITSNLSGSYNSANVAKNIYLEENPNTKIHIFDTLSAGPEMKLLLEKIRDLVIEKKEFNYIVEEGNKYLSNTKLYFALESLHNLAQNGRVSKLSEIAAKILNIKVLGQASLQGTLEVLNKCRGIKKALKTFIDYILSKYNGGKIRIAHANNLGFASQIKNAILEKFNKADIKIYECRGLCSYYAEEGGVLLGLETA